MKMLSIPLAAMLVFFLASSPFVQFFAPFFLSIPALSREGNSKPRMVSSPVSIPVPRDEAYPGVIRISVDATDVSRGIFHVEQVVPVAKSGRLTLLYPEWLPGKHAPRSAIAAIAGFRASANGELLAWTRQPNDVHAFDIEVPRGVRAITVAFDFLSPTRKSEGRITVTPAMMNLQWEQVSFYPAGYFTRNIPVKLSVALPHGWTAATALDGLKISGNRHSYAPVSYETLVDSPMFAGAHFAKWDLGYNVTLNTFADEAAHLKAKPEHITAHSALVAEAVALFGSRPFDHYEFLFALSDELGGIGLEHHRSSENSRDTGYFTKWDKSGYKRGLLPHELVHSWNGKYRRPSSLWTPDYRVPMENNLLWVYEGQTSFWDSVLAARSGMQTKAMVLGEWARNAGYYSAQLGRSWRSIDDTTHDPVTAARKPRPFLSWSRGEDYYREASLIWLEADMIIRTNTDNAKSLDDFARHFFGGRDGDWGEIVYDFDDVTASLNAVYAYDWADFLHRGMRTPGQSAPVGGIEKAGYQLVYRDTPNVFDADRMTDGKFVDLSHSLGLRIDDKGIAGSILWDGPAFRADIVNGTKILAVGGMSYSRKRMESAIIASRDGETPITLLLERGGRYREAKIFYHGGLRWPHLVKKAGGDGEASSPDWFDRLFAARRP